MEIDYRMYDAIIFKLGYEKTKNENPLIFVKSSREDGLIHLKIKHDNVYDLAVVDCLKNVVYLCIVDEYNYIVSDSTIVTTEDFWGMISDPNFYYQKAISLLSRKEE